MIGNLARFVVIPLLVSLVCSGCYHWVPVEPNFANREPRTLDMVRMDDGTVAENVSIRWPLMNMFKGGQLVTIDLRDKSVDQFKISEGRTAALVIGLTLGVSLTVAIIVVADAFGRGGYCGGC